jgi:hypothetical protein
MLAAVASNDAAELADPASAGEAAQETTGAQQDHRDSGVEEAARPPSVRPTPAATTSAARPPVLASEALRRDLAPSTPADVIMRRVCFLVGLLGGMQTLLWTGARGVAVPLAGAFATLIALGVAPMGYAARAAAIATIAGAALGITSFAETMRTGRFEPLVLTAGITVLAAALLLRSWHRASWLARGLVAFGVAVCAGFLAMSQALQRLPIVDPSWQTWLPQVLQLVLVLLLLLSLLAFMDARSTGGCGAWATAVLTWYVVFRGVEMLAARFPSAVRAARGAADEAAEGELAALHGAAPLLTCLLALALAQLWAARAAARMA